MGDEIQSEREPLTPKTKKIKSITFDRNGYIYHGRVKAFADELRENGIKF